MTSVTIETTSNLQLMGAPTPGQLYRHIDGGYYRFLTQARHADNLSVLNVYEHLWPFPNQMPWARPASEWASRFVPVTQQELEHAMRGNRKAAQTTVTEAKSRRRAAKARH